MGQKFVYVPLPDGYEDLTRREKLIWFGLCGFMNWRTGQCNPSQDSLGDAISLSRQQVRQGLRDLEARGLITWTKSNHNRGVFRLNIGRFSTAAEQFSTATERFSQVLQYKNNNKNNNMNNRGNNREAPRASRQETTDEQLDRLPLFREGGFFDQ